MITNSEIKNPKVKIGQFAIHTIMIIGSLLVILPIILVFITSISDERSVLINGYSFFPDKFSLDAYKFLFSNNLILKAYIVTIFVTVIGTTFSVILQSMLAYMLSSEKVKHRNKIAFLLYLPVLLNAGLVPWYYNIAITLGLDDTILALILPLLISSYNIFLIRNYYKSIPKSLSEAALIDGASEIKIFFKIILPLAAPITATIALFVALGYWNDWYLASWFINNENLYPLQYFLYRISSMIEYYSKSGGSIGGTVPTETVMLAAMFVTIGPIVFVYPFVQKYFISGIMIGAVKG